MSRFAIDYCTIDCNRRRLANPEEFIRSGWIRPEDQHHYADVGIDRIKLVTRGMRTDALVPIVRAYAEERSPADLMDLFPSPDKSIVYSRFRLWHLIRNFAFPTRVNVFRLQKFRALTDSRRIVIDSAALDGFLDRFLDGRCANVNCAACGHCGEVASRAIRFEDGYSADAVAAHDRVLDEIVSGRLFTYLPGRRDEGPGPR